MVSKAVNYGSWSGFTFRLHGTSDKGNPVDVTATTGSDGKAYFKDIEIGTYTLEEVSPGNAYILPEPQTVTIPGDEVTYATMENVWKHWRATITKVDADTGKATPQGDATLSGAKYGIYKGGKLVDVYYTDAKGQFTSKEYICDTDWTIREMEPSEGYLLDTTEHTVGAAPGQYTVEHNTTANAVTETVIKGSIRLIKHIDAELENLRERANPAGGG